MTRVRSAAIGLAIGSALYWWLLVPPYRAALLGSTLNQGSGQMVGLLLLALVAIVPIALHAVVMIVVLGRALHPVRAIGSHSGNQNV